MRIKGYTIIELLITVLIMVIVFVLARANYTQFAQKRALDAAARQVEADLRLTQEYALSGRKPTGCNGILNGYEFRSESSTTYSIKANCGLQPGTLVDVPGKTSVNLPVGITVNTPAYVLFKTIGQGTNVVAATPLDLVLTQAGSGRSKTVQVRAGGDIYII